MNSPTLKSPQKHQFPHLLPKQNMLRFRSCRVKSTSDLMLCQRVWRKMLMRRRMLLVNIHGWLWSWSVCWVWIARSHLFYFDRYRLWILAYSALAIGVEKDTIEGDKAFGHVAKIWYSQDVIINWLLCKFEAQQTICFQAMSILMQARSAKFTPKYLAPVGLLYIKSALFWLFL